MTPDTVHHSLLRVFPPPFRLLFRHVYYALQIRGSGASGVGSSTSGERCPICSSHFADVALLVSHVEAMHPDGAGSGGVGSGAASSCSIS